MNSSPLNPIFSDVVVVVSVSILSAAGFRFVTDMIMLSFPPTPAEIVLDFSQDGGQRPKTNRPARSSRKPVSSVRVALDTFLSKTRATTTATLASREELSSFFPDGRIGVYTARGADSCGSVFCNPSVSQITRRREHRRLHSDEIFSVETRLEHAVRMALPQTNFMFVKCATDNDKTESVPVTGGWLSSRFLVRFWSVSERRFLAAWGLLSDKIETSGGRTVMRAVESVIWTMDFLMRSSTGVENRRGNVEDISRDGLSSLGGLALFPLDHKQYRISSDVPHCPLVVPRPSSHDLVVFRGDVSAFFPVFPRGASALLRRADSIIRTSSSPSPRSRMATGNHHDNSSRHGSISSSPVSPDRAVFSQTTACARLGSLHAEIRDMLNEAGVRLLRERHTLFAAPSVETKVLYELSSLCTNIRVLRVLLPASAAPAAQLSAARAADADNTRRTTRRSSSPNHSLGEGPLSADLWLEVDISACAANKSQAQKFSLSSIMGFDMEQLNDEYLSHVEGRDGAGNSTDVAAAASVQTSGRAGGDNSPTSMETDLSGSDKSVKEGGAAEGFLRFTDYDGTGLLEPDGRSSDWERSVWNATLEFHRFELSLCDREEHFLQRGRDKGGKGNGADLWSTRTGNKLKDALVTERGLAPLRYVVDDKPLYGRCIVVRSHDIWMCGVILVLFSVFCILMRRWSRWVSREKR